MFRKERILSYLPMSHVAANMLDIHAPHTVAATVYFADKDVLKVFQAVLKENKVFLRV